ncbi:virulence factor BrkB [Pseudonocardia hierapolitana]|uniref:Virulence factor BrkB n=1 Tax=Pseudonocardia hierapolitana TaxID=1128676 RepID=A0A561SJ66_9PSEU|nr:virulence factor BrkB [Pseudonocardia hierapolitana]
MARRVPAPAPVARTADRGGVQVRRRPGGYLAALITYYGFLSLFPLLLIFSTVLGFALPGNETLQQQLVDSALALSGSGRGSGGRWRTSGRRNAGGGRRGLGRGQLRAGAASLSGAHLATGDRPRRPAGRHPRRTRLPGAIDDGRLLRPHRTVGLQPGLRTLRDRARAHGLDLPRGGHPRARSRTQRGAGPAATAALTAHPVHRGPRSHQRRPPHEMEYGHSDQGAAVVERNAAHGRADSGRRGTIVTRSAVHSDSAAIRRCKPCGSSRLPSSVHCPTGTGYEGGPVRRAPCIRHTQKRPFRVALATRLRQIENPWSPRPKSHSCRRRQVPNQV